MKATTRTSQPSAPPPSVAASLVTFAGYAELRSNVFGSVESLRWFVRKHQAELVEAGALFRLTDRWMIDPPAFDAAVLEIGARAAERATA